MDGPMGVIRPTQTGDNPDVPPRLCRVCGHLLANFLQEDGIAEHPNCAEKALQLNGPTMVPGSEHPMRTELIRLIRFADSSKARNNQVVIGPSEIGSTCDRRLAMRIAGARRLNRTSDPWPAIVGTAMHDWLERCLALDNERLKASGRPPRWITELRVNADPIISGTSDAYDTWTKTVVDWKSMGDAAKKRLADHGPSDGYQVQINTYGLGYMRAGYEVEKVALMFLPRAGKLSDARYFEWPFDPAMAQRAIERVYTIGRGVLALRQAAGTDEIWDQVPADPSNLCGWCPFFQRGQLVASSRGCPGK
jgi:hypothetical protein